MTSGDHMYFPSHSSTASLSTVSTTAAGSIDASSITSYATGTFINGVSSSSSTDPVTSMSLPTIALPAVALPTHRYPIPSGRPGGRNITPPTTPPTRDVPLLPKPASLTRSVTTSVVSNRSREEDTTTNTTNSQRRYSVGGSTASTSHTNNSHQSSRCSCGAADAVPQVLEQVDAARRKLQLWHEKLQLEEQLLKSDKRNFRKRLKAFKSSQVSMNNKLPQLQAEWEKSTTAQLQQQQSECNETIRRLCAQQEQDMTKQVQMLRAVERELQKARTKQKELELEKKELLKCLASRKSDHDESLITGDDAAAALRAAQQQIAELQNELQDQQMQMERYEMQLLEMERDVEIRPTSSSSSSSSSHNHASSCPNCSRLETKFQEQTRQLGRVQEELHDCQCQWTAADAQWHDQMDSRDLQIQTLRATCDVLHQKLSQHETKQLTTTTTDTEPVGPVQAGDGAHDETVNQTLCRSADSETKCSPTCDQTNKDATVKKHCHLVMEFDYDGPADQQPEFLTGGGKYTGWINTETNLPEGSGTFRLDEGNVIDGDWQNGKPHGTAVLATVDGDVYRGEWKNGRKHGTGCFIFTDGRVYRGEFEQDQRHGQGILTWPYGAHYQGSFVRDQRNGYGEYCYPDGRLYRGNYVDDRPHGHGVLWSSAIESVAHVIYDGHWERGEFLGDRAE